VPTQARAIGESLQELLFDFLCTENFVLFMMIPLVFFINRTTHHGNKPFAGDFFFFF
jgi:hypothetical protein